MKKLIGTFAVVGLLASAFALGTYMKVFDATYKIDKTGVIGKAKCLTCHMDPNGKGKMNAYGADIKAILKAEKTKKMTPEILAKVENMDSNGNGVKNIDEIKADKLPGAK